MRILVAGLIAQYPLGGVAWDYLQYVTGLARLGHDVFYVEDTGQWPYSPAAGGLARTPDYNVGYLARLMERSGLGERWAYRFPWQSQWFGLSDARRAAIFDSAELVINVSGCLAHIDDYRARGRLAYVDSDPVFTQVKLARGQSDFARYIGAHDVQFTFGETLGETVPPAGFKWLATRQPVALDDWKTDTPPTRPYTTVMNWSSYNPIEFGGRRYEQKDVEFMKFVELPQAVGPQRLEIALNATGKKSNAPVGLLRKKGWNLVDPAVVAADADAYRAFIQSSRGEWSVAKGGYVLGACGWFSCRSACYLAAGRPVIAQDTGFSRVLPVGQGLFAFDTFEDAVGAIEAADAEYERHARAARALASEYFCSTRVLPSLIERALAA